MFKNRILVACLALLTACAVLATLNTVGQAGGDKKKAQKKVEKKKADVWTDPSDPSLPADFKFQGEYVRPNVGCQVIALGNGAFQAVLCEGGLPGAGWNGKKKHLMDGKLEGDKVVFVPSTGKRKYLAQSPLEFSATAKFPPVGQAEYTATITKGFMTVSGKEDGKAFTLELSKLVHKSDTLGAKAPSGAIVLFDGSSKDEWNGGRIDKKTGFLNTDGGEVTTKRKFNNYIAHVEFMLPYRPDARGQGRGNSGFYQVDHYEVQILDSFGLEGKDNECSGIYSQFAPKVNMCLPPLQWQTYDVEFTNAVRDASGKKVKNSRITVKLNGVIVHDDLELTKGVTGGARSEPEGTPGLLRLQGHGNPLQFRNIWVVEKK